MYIFVRAVVTAALQKRHHYSFPVDKKDNVLIKTPGRLNNTDVLTITPVCLNNTEVLNICDS